MQIIITGMKRQILDESMSICSNIEEIPQEGTDFFEDSDD